MNLSYLLIFLSITAWAQPRPRIEVIPTPKALEDFDHHYKGCPENSECDQVMGLQLTRWNDLIQKLKNEVPDARKRTQYLELFRSKYGIPVEFYTTQKSQQGFKPLLFDSPCKDHNPKEGTKILKGQAFLKSMNEKSATAWRDQTQIEVPISDLMTPQPVFVYNSDEPMSFFLPLGDQPLFIRDQSLYVLKEEDDLFFVMKVSKTGDWKIEEVDMTRLSEWEGKKSNVACPKTPVAPNPGTFKDEFCKMIWNDDLKKPVVVKMHMGCTT